MNRRILIQKGQAYLQLPNQWVEDRNAANDFQTPIGAIIFCEQNKLDEVQIVLALGDGEWNMVLREFPWRKPQQ